MINIKFISQLLEIKNQKQLKSSCSFQVAFENNGKIKLSLKDAEANFYTFREQTVSGGKQICFRTFY